MKHDSEGKEDLLFNLELENESVRPRQAKAIAFPCAALLEHTARQTHVPLPLPPQHQRTPSCSSSAGQQHPGAARKRQQHLLISQLGKHRPDCPGLPTQLPAQTAAPLEGRRRDGGSPEPVPVPPPPAPPAGPARPGPLPAPLPVERGSRAPPPARARGGTNRGLPPLQPRVRIPSARRAGPRPAGRERRGPSSSSDPPEPSPAQPGLAQPSPAGCPSQPARLGCGRRARGGRGPGLCLACCAGGGAAAVVCPAQWETRVTDQPHFPRSGVRCPRADFSQHELSCVLHFRSVPDKNERCRQDFCLSLQAAPWRIWQLHQLGLVAGGCINSVA